jgi:glycyl-tRNA synthetase (class II)
MTYQDYIIKCEVAKTVFKIGVSSALSIETATSEQKLAWITEDLVKLDAELDAIGKAFDEQDEVGDPFAEEVK